MVKNNLKKFTSFFLSFPFMSHAISHSVVSSTVHGLRLEKSFQNISAEIDRDCHNLSAKTL